MKILKQFICKNRFLITGTPIQNNIQELWALLNFIEPTKFGDLLSFQRDYGNMKDVGKLERLKLELKPYLIRRMKTDVEKTIPPLQETIVDIEMTNVQKIIYKTIYQKNRRILLNNFKNVKVMNNIAMQLRKCCNHPFTIESAKQEILKDVDLEQQFINKLVNTSGKMIFLDQLIRKYRQ